MYEIPEDNEVSPDLQFPGPGSAGSGNRLDMLESDGNKRVSSVLYNCLLQSCSSNFRNHYV